MARLLDGKACSKAIEEELKAEVATLSVVPKLVLLLVGSNPDSKTYVKLKKNACTRVGIEAEIREIDEADLHAQICALNEDPSVHGILLQLPLPASLAPAEQRLLHTVRPERDVDGLHPHHFYELPRLTAHPASHRHLHLPPCTPAGCLELLTRNGIEVADKDVVIIGRGQLVGLPLSLMMLQRNATVTTCHTHTKDLAEKVKRADIVVVATGKPELVRGDWVKDGAVVIDVGINYVDDATSKKGYKILGDVTFDEVSAKASAITPVPGGIGPMTIAMLLKNVVASAKFAAAAPAPSAKV
ncbi:TPA: hypothetical protein N0F65_006758 [Lagenidium giganteum]|uniref:Methenyltetrahydrofolate cyclohydrolase n=1 Tax=Lagenidium giganteum TaxID=4803 RepID=A0AAV2YYR5_9STRA|nr:TPA: hypothetical protein N0F65_006758 [Lagenidium giganteum]